jgi:hypothetical protein
MQKYQQFYSCRDGFDYPIIEEIAKSAIVILKILAAIVAKKQLKH